MTSSAGAHLVAWSQTRIDARRPGPVAALRPGAMWEWRGRAIPVVASPARPDDILDDAVLLGAIRRALPAARFREGLDSEAPILDRCVTLVHGSVVFEALLVELVELAHPMILFGDGLPPPGEGLRVARVGDVPRQPWSAGVPDLPAPLTAARIRV